MRACDKKRTACVNINNDLTVHYLQRVGTRSGGRCDMRRSTTITDYILSCKRIIPADETCTTICVEWVDHFGRSLK